MRPAPVFLSQSGIGGPAQDAGHALLEGGKNLVALNMITSRIRHHIDHCNDPDDAIPGEE